MDLQKAYSNRKKIEEVKREWGTIKTGVWITLRMTDGYGIPAYYRVMNMCPYDGTLLRKTGVHHACFDGEWDTVDQFTCEKNCVIQYQDIFDINGIER